MSDKVKKLEENLSKYIFKRRMIEFISLFVGIVICILFFVLRDLSKEVIITGEGIFKHETIVYNDYYIIGILIGFFGSIIAGSFLLSDCLYSRYATTKANGYYITVYKGMLYNILYIDGEEVRRITYTRYSSGVIETKLPDGVKVCVSFNRLMFTIAHISYSDNNASIDL